MNISFLSATDNSWFGIGFSIFAAGLASLNLLLDFDLIERGVRGAAPKHMEWFAGLGLLVTVVWLYLEMLRLLARLRSNEVCGAPAEPDAPMRLRGGCGCDQRDGIGHERDQGGWRSCRRNHPRRTAVICASDPFRRGAS